jgi:hypothetical protein
MILISFSFYVRMMVLTLKWKKYHCNTYCKPHLLLLLPVLLVLLFFWLLTEEEWLQGDRGIMRLLLLLSLLLLWISSCSA